jgi:hypothetical protein
VVGFEEDSAGLEVEAEEDIMVNKICDSDERVQAEAFEETRQKFGVCELLASFGQRIQDQKENNIKMYKICTTARRLQ